MVLYDKWYGMVVGKVYDVFICYCIVNGTVWYIVQSGISYFMVNVTIWDMVRYMFGIC